MYKLLSIVFLFGSGFASLMAQSPGGVAGSVFWVKGGVGVTGTTNVSAWTDQSGSGNNATQGVAGNQPALVINDINFNSSINFYQPVSIMSLTTPPANLNATVFSVAIPKANNDWRTMFRGALNDHPIIIENGSDRLGYYDNDNAGFNFSGFLWTQNEVALVGLEMRTGNTNFRKNGSQGSPIAGITLTSLNLDYLGAFQGGSQNFGRIAETIIFNTGSALTTTEKNKVESYLGVKYGLTIAHDYLATDGTVIWNSTTNATYHHDVAGIGRDDNTGLDQRKSLSVNVGAGVTLDKGAAFGTDKNYILWGNDAGTGSSTNIPSTYTVRTTRVWKVAVTGAPGSVTFSADLSALGFPNTTNAANYALLKDTDADFSAGATPITTGASIVGNTLSFTSVSFADGDFFSIAVSTVLPGGISGAVFWVKGGAGVTLSPNVSLWADQSGFINNVTQGTTANQPLLVANDVNFNSSINFSGTTMVMTQAIPAANLNSTVFTVAVPTVNTSWRTMFRGVVNDHPMIIETGSTRLGYYDNDNGGFQYSGFNWPQNEVAVVGMEMRSGDVNFRKNGTQGASINTISLTGLNLDFFGNYPSGGQNFGEIEETIIYNTPSALNTTQKNEIESYLAVKYGITLTHDYLATDGTVTWNSTTNATYQHDIAGIGRDDNTGLNQQKSLSINVGAGVTLDKGGAFATDKNFILWGNDAGVGTSTNIPAAYTFRTNRVWRVAVTGAPGSVTFSADLAALGFPNTGVAADYALLKDTDTDFSAGATAVTSGASIVGSILTFTGVSFSNGDFFSIAGGNIVVPGGIPGLNVWLKANLGPEKAVGVPAGNGDAITSWKDKSGFGHDYSVVAGPTLVANTINFNPMVEILSGGFDAPAGSELSTDWTVFFISQKLASQPVGRLFDGNIGNNLWAHWNNFTNSIYIEGNPSNYNSGIATTTGTQTLHLHSYKRAASGSLEARADGTSLATFAGTNSASGIRIDIDQGNYSSGGEHSNARVGEMIMYNAAITPTEVSKVESYLAVKYGLTVAHDYLATDGTVIWNSTTNATYHHDVAGIGRDDNTALDQRKSLSINAGAGVTLDKGSAFGTDKSFVLWGNDAATGTSTNIPATYTLRTKRVWKVAVTGAPGNVTFTADLAVLGFPNTGTATDYALLKDTDTDFSTGATAITSGVSLVGSILTFTGVGFTNGDFFSIAGGNILLPGGTPGLMVWLKANSGVEKAGAVPAGNGDAITTWRDKSGNGFDYIAAAGPTLQSSTINFNPSVEILAGGFDAPAGSELSTDWTVFFVSQKLASQPVGRLFDGHIGNNLWAHWSNFTNSIYLEGNPSNYNSGIATTTGTQNLHLHSYKRAASGSLEARADGTSQTTFAGTNSASGIRIDIDQGNYSAGGEHSNARVGEMIMYSTAITATEVMKVESYLAIKYGLTVAHDYLATDGTVIWNSTTNATYHHDVAGIGRDDNTGQDQRKSLSVNVGAGVTLDKGGAFGTDKNFILWGNDAGSGTSLNVPAGYTLRTNRVWKVAVTGAPGTVTFSADLTALGFPNTGNAANYALLKDTDNDFSSGATAHTTGASIAGSIISFTGLSLNDGAFFALAGANLPFPGGVTGLVFWVRGGTGVTGTTNVSVWADQSGNSNNATQGVAANQPALVSNDVNFNSSINFSGNIMIMSLAAPPANLNSTVFTVAVPTVNTNWRTMFRGVVNDHPLIVETGSTRLGYYDGDNIGFDFSGFNWAQNEVALVGLEMRAGNVNFRKNGAQGGAIATINLAGLNLDYLGNYQGGSQNFGEIEETIIYNTAAALTATEKSKIESYLAVKYGLTLTHDYLATDATTTWNTTTNAAYQNRVTGVGRDDNTGLDQRKSLSVNAGGVVTMDKGGAFASDKSFILWGDNNAAMAASGVADYPGSQGLIGRIARAWKIAVTGAPGSVAVRFDLSSVTGSKTAADLRLLIDRNKNGVLADETVGGGGVVSGAVDLGGGVFEFSGVTLNDGELISIGTVNSNTPLPITLISFMATNVGRQVQINWLTASELNNDYFTLEKSKDAGEFSELAKVKGAGTSHNQHTYEFFDTTPFEGINYYRLKQTDFNMISTLSKIIKINVDSPDEKWTIYPNPATREFVILGSAIEQADVMLTNLLGQKVVVSSIATVDRLSFDTSNLPRGMYLLTIVSNGITETRKIVLE